MPILKRLDQISKDDLSKLIDDQEQESQTLEFKRDVSFKAETALVEFLRDVSALANCEGGDLIIGIEEDDGRANGLAGTSHTDVESLESAITSHCLKHLSPPLGGVQLKSIDCDGKWIVLVRIPQSWSVPHQVTCGGDRRFYLRRGREKLTMTTEELRRSFGFAESGVQKLKAFREERVQRAAMLKHTKPHSSSPLLVFHLMPLQSFLQSVNYDMVKLIEGKALNFGNPSIWDRSFNFDGILVNHLSATLIRSQVFRSGCVEFVSALTDKGVDIDAQTLVRHLNLWTKYSFDVVSSLGVYQPFFLGVSLVNVFNHKLWAFKGHDGPALDREQILVPEVMAGSVVESETGREALLMPVLNIIAQGFGNQGWGKWGVWGDRE